MDTITQQTAGMTAPSNASYVMRPLSAGSWDTAAHVVASPSGVVFGATADVATAFAGVEAAGRVGDLRNVIALQGAAPPRENPR